MKLILAPVFSSFRLTSPYLYVLSCTESLVIATWCGDGVGWVVFYLAEYFSHLWIQNHNHNYTCIHTHTPLQTPILTFRRRGSGRVGGGVSFSRSDSRRTLVEKRSTKTIGRFLRPRKVPDF